MLTASSSKIPCLCRHGFFKHPRWRVSVSLQYSKKASYQKFQKFLKNSGYYNYLKDSHLGKNIYRHVVLIAIVYPLAFPVEHALAWNSFVFPTIVGFRYGKTLVPFLNVDQESMKLEANKCLEVLCFSPSSCVSKYSIVNDLTNMYFRRASWFLH